MGSSRYGVLMRRWVRIQTLGHFTDLMCLALALCIIFVLIASGSLNSRNTKFCDPHRLWTCQWRPSNRAIVSLCSAVVPLGCR